MLQMRTTWNGAKTLPENLALPARRRLRAENSTLGVTCWSARRLPPGRFLSRLPRRPRGRGRPGRYRAGEGPGRFRIRREVCREPALWPGKRRGRRGRWRRPGRAGQGGASCRGSGVPGFASPAHSLPSSLQSLRLGPAPLLPVGCPRSRRLDESRRPTHFVSPSQLTTRRTPKSLKSDALESL